MEADLEKDDLSRAQSPAGQFKVLYAWQEDLAPEGDAARASELASTLESQDVGAAPKTEAEIQVWLVSQLSAMLHIAPQELNISEPFTRYGLDSADAVKAMGKVEAWLGRSLSPTLFWDYPNVEALVRHLAGVPEVAPQPVSAATP